MITEENGECLPHCIQQNGGSETLKGNGIAKGQESETNILSSMTAYFEKMPCCDALLMVHGPFRVIWPTSNCQCLSLHS